MKRILLLVICATFVVACKDGEYSKRAGDRQDYDRQLVMRTFGLPLNNPGMVPGTEASFMEDDDLVIGTLIGNRARAYPWWLLRAYHIVNDTVCSDASPGVDRGEEKDTPCIPILVTFCEACSGSAVFEAAARFRGDESESGRGPMLTFFWCGSAKGSWIGCDRQTNSRWYPFLGSAYQGELKGAHMKRLPSFLTTWNDWRTQHPETLVTTGSAEIRARPHGHTNVGPIAGAFPGYELSDNPRLGWMSPWDMVYGLIPPRDRGAILPRAYPLEHLRSRGGLVQTEFADVPIVLITRNQFHVVGFDRRAGGRVLNFAWAEEDERLDLVDQDGNRWTAYGTGASDANKGQRLNIVDGYITEWYEWAEKFRDTELAGHER